MTKTLSPTAPVHGQVGVALASGHVMTNQQYAPMHPAPMATVVQTPPPVATDPVLDTVVGKPKKGV
jgi:hypothetical protein